MTTTHVDYTALSDGMVTAEHITRLAALGIEVATAEHTDVPLFLFRAQPQVYLVTPMGTMGGVYTGEHDPTDLNLHPRRQVTLLDGDGVQALHLKASRIGTVFFGWEEFQDMDAFLIALEELADRVETWGASRPAAAQAWALRLMLVQWGRLGTRGYHSLVKAVRRLNAAGVAPARFYETLDHVVGKQHLERAVDASIFHLAHPDIHPALVREMFT